MLIFRGVHTWKLLGGGNFFFLNPENWEDEPILTIIFQMGWNHQPD